MKTMRTLGIALIALLVLGCEAKDRDSIAKETGKAWEHASRAAVTAWASLSKKVDEITPDSTMGAIEEARKAAASAQEQLSKIPNPTPEILKQIEAAKAAVAKLDAAQRLRDLQDRASAMVADAQKQADNAGKSAEAVRQNLMRANETFQKLQTEIQSASERYDQTAAELRRLTGQ